MKNYGKKWTELEDRFIRIYYPENGPSIYKSLNRTRGAVKTRAKILKVCTNSNYKRNQHPISNEEKECMYQRNLKRKGIILEETLPEDKEEPSQTLEVPMEETTDNLEDSMNAFLASNLKCIRQKSFRYQMKRRIYSGLKKY